MSVLIKHMAMPKGCIYANDKDQTEYCPLLNHDDVPFCQYIENEPEIAIGIDERPVYCPLSDVPEPCQDAVSRAATIDALDEIESEVADGYGYQYEKWRKYFCELPSVQPKRTKKRTGTHACDCISRQAAIDKLDPLFESLAIDKIKALPTAQDVIRCKDCRFQDKGSNESESWNLCGYRPWLHVPTEDEHYCGYAERRTDE